MGAVSLLLREVQQYIAISLRYLDWEREEVDLLDELEPGGEVHPEVCFTHLFPHDGRVHRAQSPPVYDPSLVRESS